MCCLWTEVRPHILPESKWMSACLLLLQLSVEATSVAEYDRPQWSFTEQEVSLDEQDATWPCSPVTSTVWKPAPIVSAQEKFPLFVPQSTRAVKLVGWQGAEGGEVIFTSFFFTLLLQVKNLKLFHIDTSYLCLFLWMDCSCCGSFHPVLRCGKHTSVHTAGWLTCVRY